MFAVVTRGSSTCIPTVESVSANGQTLSVEVVDPGGDVACTDDLATRASLAAVPEGVDPTQEVELLVTYGDQRDDVELDGDPALTATPGSETDYQPSAGWFDDGGLVLLTWGSSGCPPVVESVHADGEDRGTVTFATDEDKVCTLDMAPRATLLSFDDDVEDDDFELTLQGGGLDAVVTVIG